MASVSRGRSAGLPGSTSLSRHQPGRLYRSSASSAARHYWSARHTNTTCQRHPSGVYSYMRPYPHRDLPRYSGRVDDLDHRYMRGVYQNCGQIRRSSSDRRPEKNDKRRASGHADDKSDEASRGAGQRYDNPWETRTRMAGERYLRLMEEQMRLLQKDPYNILFGGSESRGVWNPWRRYYEMHQKMVNDAFSRPVQARGKSSTDTTSATRTEAPEASSQHKPESADINIATPAPTSNAANWRFDPISCKNVLHEEVVKPAKMDIVAGHSISVKPFKPKPAKIISGSVPVTSKQGIIDEQTKAPLSGFARQPWLVKEGFVPSSLASSLQTDESSKPDSKKDNPVMNANSSYGSNQTLPISQKISAPLMDRPKAASSSALMSTSNDLLKDGAFWYDDRPDKREDLDLLRASDVRAASGKIVKPLEPTLSREERWAKVEGAMSTLFKDREDRLYREFAADRWELKRTWSAYPGEISRNIEERRARRRLLERSFNSSLNLFEHEMMKALGLANSPFQRSANGAASCEEGLGIHSTSSMRNVASYIQNLRQEIRARHTDAAKARQNERNREADAMLQREIDMQKAAMQLHENRPRIAKSYKLSSPTGVKVPKAALLNEQVKALRENRESARRSKMKEDELIREIRSIYEDSYGTINTQHRQGAPKSSAQTSSRTVDATYSDVKPQSQRPDLHAPFTTASSTTDPAQSDFVVKPAQQELDSSEIAAKDTANIKQAQPPPNKVLAAAEHIDSSAVQKEQRPSLSSSRSTEDSPRHKPLCLPEERPSSNFILLSYDKTNRKVRVIRTSSSKYEERAARRSTMAIMDRLGNPVQYFDHIETLEASGYELVAGSKDLLVYKDTLNRSLGSQIDVAALLKATSSTKQGSADVAAKVAAETVKIPSRQAEARQQTPVISSNGPSQLVRRMEERFSGPGMRFTDEPPEQQQQQQEAIQAAGESHRSTFKQVFWRTLAIVGVIYGFGVFMEWAKERDREQLTKEYQREVQRVRELERRRAEEEKSIASRWGF